MMGSTNLNGVQRLGELALRLNYLSRNQLEQALVEAAALRGQDGMPGAVFLQLGLLTERQLKYLQDVLKLAGDRIADRRFGDLAVARGLVTQEQIQAALQAQAQRFAVNNNAIKIGELLVEQGLLTPEQKERLLAEQAQMRPQVNPASAAVVTAVRPATERVIVEQSLYRILVSEDRMHAFLVLTDPDEGPELAQLQEQLHQAGIKETLDQTALASACVASTPVNERILIAAGRPPTESQDGHVEYCFRIDPFKPGTEAADGSIDFKERGKIPAVTVDTVLAKRTPAIRGRDGRDVYGRAVPARKPDTPRWRIGQGVKFTADELQIVATVAGQPRLTADGKLSVISDYVLAGDVGYETGHIDYPGRVVVNGTVRSGFCVTCGELVAKEIEAAQVKVAGHVVLSGGIMGARIDSLGGVQASFIHSATVVAASDISVRREIIDAHLFTSGVLDAPTCAVFSSEISAFQGIHAKQIGSEDAQSCRVTVGMDEATSRRIVALEQEVAEQREHIARLQTQFSGCERRRQLLNDEIQHNAQIQDRGELRRRELQAQLSQAGADIAAIQRELEPLLDTVRVAGERLDRLFAEQDENEQQTVSIPQEIAGCKARIDALEADIQAWQDWSAAQLGQATVTVAADLFAGTQLQTPHLKVRTTSGYHAVSLIERESRNEQGQSSWRLARRR